MVKISENVLDINNTQRIKQLEDITIEKHKSIADKKKELEVYEKQKKKELEELDKKKDKELKDLENKRAEIQKLESEKLKDIEHTKRLIDNSLQDVVRHKKILSEEEDSKKKLMRDSTTIDEIAREKTIDANEAIRSNVSYSKFFDDLESPKKFYDVANNSFYNNLNKLLDKARDGEISNNEQQFIENLQHKFNQFNSNDSYVDQDRNNYLKRSINVIERIGSYIRQKE